MRSGLNAKRFLEALLLGGALMIMAPAVVFADGIGQIQGDGTTVLTAASPSAEMVGLLRGGLPVQILGAEGDFLKISYGSDESLYVSRHAVSVEEADGIVNDSQVNVRDFPGKEGRIIAKVDTDEIYPTKGIIGDWYLIDYKGQDAYIHMDFLAGSLLRSLKTVGLPAKENSIPSPSSKADSSSKMVSSKESMFAVVQADTGLNLRSNPAKDSPVIQILRNGSVMDVLDVSGEWITVDYYGTTGYVNSEFVMLSTGIRPESPSTKADEIIAYAKQFLGTPYRYAGTNLNTGVDCSGFVYSVMKNFGVTLNRSSREMVRNGSAVSKSQLMPGDLVFFDTNGGGNKGNISHVGIYIGNGSFIHSSSSSRAWGVVITSLSDDYYVRNYVTACRVLSTN